MRGKKTIKNTLFSLISEIVTIICSFILPKLILSAFGSKYNGLITSISQFLACAVLLRSGIGGATRAALYKPLATNDKEKINSIVKATDLFMKKVGLILALLIVVFASLYPIFVSDEFEWIFVFTLFLIIGLATFSESFFGITYLIILQADQKNYISSIISIICNIINIIITSVLIISGFSIHIVKASTALIFCIQPILLGIYVKRKYKIKKDVVPNTEAINQRWDAFWHQVAIFVNNNTDIMILTALSNMLEVSVYSVYHMITHGLSRFINSFTNSIESAFGNMIANKEKEKLKENLSIFEFIVFNLSTLLFSTAIVLAIPFVYIYTKGINDVNYIRPVFSILLISGEFVSSIKLPYLYIIQAAGHFKETKKYAIREALINIILSVALVMKFGLIGVAIGTLVGVSYKTIMFSKYTGNKIIKRNNFEFIKKLIISIFEIIIIYCVMSMLNVTNNIINISYIFWLKNAIITMIISFIIIFIGIVIFYREDFKLFRIKLKRIILH